MKVFVSSTYIDLAEHRRAVAKMLLRMNLEPVAMEDFGARGTDATTVCFDEIERCDAFIGIYARRYGYQPEPGGPSITEREYVHARATKKLILCYFIDPACELAKSSAQEPGMERLERFKYEVEQQYVCDKFTTPESLAAGVAAALATELTRRARRAADSLADIDWERLPPKAVGFIHKAVYSGETSYQSEELKRAAAALVKHFPSTDTAGETSRRDLRRAAIVLRHEYFGSLIHVRAFADYIAFDHQATDIFLRARERPLRELASVLPDETQRVTLERFGALAQQAGVLSAAGTFNGIVLDAAAAPDARLTAPIRVVLSCTRACTYQCPHCVLSAGTPLVGELSTREITRLIDHMVEIGCFLLDLDGGEPLARADLPAIVEHANASGVAVRITTNAAAATPEIVEQLRRLKVESFRVRLDAATPAVFDKLRESDGAFDAATKGITRLRGLRVPIHFVWRVTPASAHELDAMAALASELGVQSLSIIPVIPTGRAGDHPHTVLDRAAVERLSGAAVDVTAKYSLPISTPLTPRRAFLSSDCSCGTTTCHVGPRGEVTPSGLNATAVAGDTLRERNLATIWASSSAFASARDRVDDTDCPSCGFYSQYMPAAKQ